MATEEFAHIKDGTLEGLDEFCNWVIAKGLMRAPSVEPIRSATRQIMATVEPDNPDLDLRTINRDEIVARFETLAGHKYAPDSLRAYSNRFNRALDLYGQYLENGPSGFKPPAGRAPRKRASQPPSTDAQSSNGTAATHGPAAPAVPQSLIDYPFPTSAGTIAHLYLPQKLEKADAERMATFIRALVLEPQRQLESGDPT
jgi:hypothetical protein